MLSEENDKYVEFGMAGVCNLCLGRYGHQNIMDINLLVPDVQKWPHAQ